jgi:hypothetical protein
MTSEHEQDYFKVAEDLKSFVKGVVKGSVYKTISALKKGESASESASDRETFTYIDVLEYAVEKRLKYPDITSTLLKLDPSPRGVSISQVFIDNTGEICKKGQGYLGRKVSVKEIDGELKDLFEGEESVVIDLPKG